RLVVARVDAHALGADRIVLGQEDLGYRRVLNHGADLLAAELGGRVIGVLVEQQVDIGRGEAQAAALPPLLVLAPPLLWRHRERGGLAALHHEADARLARLAPEVGVARLHLSLEVRVEGRVARWGAEVRRALEDEQVRGLSRDDRDRLDGRGAGADHPDPLAAEVDALVRPASRVIRGTPEALPARKLRYLGRGQATGRHDAEARRHAVAVVRRDGPAPAGLVEGRYRHPRSDLDVAPQVEAIGDVIDVGQDLRLRGVPLAPLPLLLQLVRERVRIVHALDVASRAWVAIPVPGAANAEL